MNAWKLWDNPLIVRGARSRLRLPLLGSWGLVTVVASTFLYTYVYGMAVKNETISPAEAAREAILPLLIMQGVILMVMGTGAVAGGVARERTYRLLDYQRLTPMTPGTKIVGMLFGLPIREYFMFAVSLPFVFYAAWVGGLSLGVLIPFYMVFISSAIVYHMTGLAAGMVVDKPWRAGTVSQGLVVVLYLLLPQASNVGFTFFEFLTARPVFLGMVQEHLLPDGTAEAWLEEFTGSRYQSVAFFGFALSPVVFSLAVQAFAILSLLVIVHRKWQSDAMLPFSKRYALIFFAIGQFFLVGSVVPFLRTDELFFGLSGSYKEIDDVNKPRQVIVFAIFLVTLTVSGCMALLAVYLCTPTWYQSVTGLRRALRRGDRRLRWTDDTATSTPIALACLLMCTLSCIAIYRTADAAGRVAADNPAIELILPLVLFAGVLFSVQQVIEQFSERVFVMCLFLFWMVPVLIAVVVWGVQGQPVVAYYIALLFPFTGLWSASALLNSDPTTHMSADVLPRIFAEHAGAVVLITVLLYGAAAMALLLRARRRWQKIRIAAGQTPIELPSVEQAATPLSGASTAG